MHKGPGAPSGRKPDGLRTEDGDGEKAGLGERAMYRYVGSVFPSGSVLLTKHGCWFLSLGGSWRPRSNRKPS